MRVFFVSLRMEKLNSAWLGPLHPYSDPWQRMGRYMLGLQNANYYGSWWEKNENVRGEKEKGENILHL